MNEPNDAAPGATLEDELGAGRVRVEEITLEWLARTRPDLLEAIASEGRVQAFADARPDLIEGIEQLRAALGDDGALELFACAKDRPDVLDGLVAAARERGSVAAQRFADAELERNLAAARDQGAAAERARILGLDELALLAPSQRGLIQRAKHDGTSVEDAALAIITDERQRRSGVAWRAPEAQ